MAEYGIMLGVITVAIVTAFAALSTGIEQLLSSGCRVLPVVTSTEVGASSRGARHLQPQREICRT